MKVKVQKLTDLDLARWAAEMTMRDKKSFIGLDTIYTNKHSLIYTQLFKIEMFDIPYAQHVHFRTHSANGLVHFVSTSRPDLVDVPERYGKVNHGMLCNAMHLIDMSHKRLCYKAEDLTLHLMRLIQDEIYEVDPALARHLEPMCSYLGRCPEGANTCGMYKEW